MSQATQTDVSTAESAVYQRYASAAQAVEPELCCPVDYRAEYLTAIPEEVIQRDYGCGDPSRFVCEGDDVLDLGSGGGKICFIASQIVGKTGSVTGVDCNQEMLQLARRSADAVAANIGYHNTSFRYGLIQDLALDLDDLTEVIASQPVSDATGYLRLRNLEEQLRTERPMIADESIDCVLSNCVLNLVRQPDRKKMFSEIFRVLRRGGRAAISDIVSDESVPERLQQDSALWSGCITGAFREDEFLAAFEDAGFHGMELVKRESDPWRTVEGIEFRSVTVVAYKGKQGPCLERNQAVVYRGPFKKVEDDDGHVFRRGDRMAVCDKTFGLLQQAPYLEMFAAVEPRERIPLENAVQFDCRRSAKRDPRETKGTDYDATSDAPAGACSDGACC
ncbi:methyltransferase domain-containing protein [Stieleria varia]|uniref:Arsenite methyltransferase n=1 Tax=Stieleria varia TaxID=2528005 RepID=A0A5C6B3M1_9BACT|nr:methyltransferase domain-containing protein [Stieleria varia]TWU06132.1 arsenite S-adenosylmethyltransferase [Stieleria varia]